MPAFTNNAQASDKSQQRFVYEVYAGGIHAVQADLNMDITPGGNYSLVLSAKTRGLLGRLAPWHGTFESHGWALKNGERIVEQHKSTTTWRDEEEIKDYAYTRNGKFKSLTIDEHDKPPRIEDIDAEITDNTTDALTAALLTLESYLNTQKCEGTSKVFDGKRSFEQKFIHKDTVELSPSKYNLYEGQAAECTIEVLPLKGKWYKKPRGWMSIQEQGREKGTMPTLWIASLAKGEPAIPVKIRVKTNYGTLFMHLAEYQNGSETIIAENRITEEE